MVHIEDLLMASKWVAFTNLWHYYQRVQQPTWILKDIELREI